MVEPRKAPTTTALTAAAVATGVLALGLGGCASAGRALGLSKVTPDEFRVVARAPLVVPPDYSLRPPSPGEPRPQELQPESQARLAMLGARAAETRTQGESLLVSKAGADKADPLIRYVMDDEFGSLAHKDKSFADKVMFWKKGDAQVVRSSAGDGVVIDPAAEQAKIQSLIGTKQAVVILRAPPKRRAKLPGL